MNTDWSKPTKYIVGVSLALLGVLILYLSRAVIPLLIIAALIAVIVRPVILWLHVRARLRRGLAVGLVYLVLAILVPVLLLFAVPVIVDALRNVANLDYPGILRDITGWLRTALASIKAVQLPSSALDATVDRVVDELLIELQGVAPTLALEPPPVATILQSLGGALAATFDAAAGVVGAVISKAAVLIFMFLASIYISLEAHTYRGAILRLAPPAYRPELAVLIAKIERMWGAFFRGELTLMLVIGGMSWVGLTMLGMPGALSLAIIAGLLEFIPNLGPIIAAIPAVVAALMQGSNSLPVNHLAFAGLVILLYILVQQLENSLIVPRVLGEAVQLPPLVVMTGVLVGASVGGILGTLLATPIIATGREILRYIYRKMQGEEPFLPEETTQKPAAPVSIGPGVWLRKRIPRLSWPHSPAARQCVAEIAPSSKSEPDNEMTLL
jgi:predicted PurR-regulated permease PerM